jgi:uncharacterized protein (TIGR02145 family)
MKTKRINLFYFAVVMLFMFASAKSYALNYTISFTASGAASTVGSVQVQNLTKGTTVTVPGGNTLTLTDVTTAVQGLSIGDNNCRIVQNSSNGSFDLSLNAAEAGEVNVNAYTIDGRKIVGVTKDLDVGRNSFELLLPKGLFVVRVSGKGINYSNKIINQTNAIQQAKIKYLNNSNAKQSAPQKSKSIPIQTTTMTYSSGDQLLYKGISGNYSTIVTDKPIASKTTNFEFIECKDADNNYYTVVKIGTQTWMAENLKTTKYRNGSYISTTSYSIAGEVTPKYQWPYNNYEGNVNSHGRLYTWYAATDLQNLTPIGWHLPSSTEWVILINYLIDNIMVYSDLTTGSKTTKSIASTINWDTNNCTTGTIGNDLTRNNSTGFTALASGYHNSQGKSNGTLSVCTAWWWSDVDAGSLYSNTTYLQKDIQGIAYLNAMKNFGCSIRCLKD